MEAGDLATIGACAIAYYTLRTTDSAQIAHSRDGAAAEERGAGVEELKSLLGRARAKKGMYEGDLQEGELEIGQVSALVKDILPAGTIVKNIWEEFIKGLENPVKRNYL